MASEIRVNQIQSRTGVSTISFTETGPIISGVTTITGDLDVTGLVSYDDVTNIDSVGVVTARSGIRVGGDANNGTAEGIKLDEYGFIQISRGGGVSALWAGYTQGSSTQTSRIDNDGDAHFLGKLGVGTNNPGTKLDVRGGNWSNGDIVVGQSGNAGRINFRRGADGSDAAYLGYDGATNNSQVALAVNSGDGTILFKTNSTERLRINSTGNIGIGTDNPGEPLHVFVGNGGNGEPIALFEHNHGGGGDASIRIEGGASGNPDEVYLELCDKDDIANSFTMGMNDDISRLRFEYGARGANNGRQLLTLDQFGAARFNGASGVLRDPTIDNTSYVGLSLWPSGTSGATNYSDRHNISFTQEDGNWLDGHSNTTKSSFGMVFNYTSDGTTMRTRGGIHYDHRGAERLKIWSSYGDISFKVDSGSSGNETWTTCDKEVMRLSHDGHVLRPTMAAVCCTTTGNTTLSTFNTSFQTIAVNVEGFDNANNFNTSNYRFTAPETGFYQVGCNVQLENGSRSASGNRWMYIYPLINGATQASTSNGNNEADFDPADTYYYNWTYTTLLKLSQNDYVEWKYRGNLDSIILKGGVESTYYFYQVG